MTLSPFFFPSSPQCIATARDHSTTVTRTRIAPTNPTTPHRTVTLQVRRSSYLYMQPNPLQVERLTEPYPKNKASITGQARSKTTTRTLFSPLRSESTANSSTPIGKHQPTISLLQVSRGGQGGGSHADRSSVRKSGRRNTKHKKCYGRRRIRRAGGWRRAIGSAAYRRLDLGTCRSVLCMYAIYATTRQMTFFCYQR